MPYKTRWRKSLRNRYNQTWARGGGWERRQPAGTADSVVERLRRPKRQEMAP
jgi:hypothetical protein